MKKYFDLKYYPQLDGLRGVAILLVMLFHAKIPFFTGGYIGVDIFFVLSGFLISSSLIKEFKMKNNINLKYFYIKRIRRLFPALFLFLVVYIIISYITLNSEEANKNFIDSIIALFYITNWVQAFEIRSMGLIKHTWSLSIEEQFYLIWPITIYILLKNTRINYILGVIFLLSLLSWGHRALLVIFEDFSLMRSYSGLDTRFDALMVGCMLSILFNYFYENLKRIYNFFIQLMTIISILYLAYIVGRMSWLSVQMFTLHFYTTAICSAFIIYSILINDKSIICFIFKNNILVKIGKISYGLYLWHYPIFYILRSENSPLFVFLFGGSLSLVLALLSYNFIEKKFHYRKFDQPCLIKK